MTDTESRSMDHAPAIDDAAMERQASDAWAALGATSAGRQTRRAVAALLIALADVPSSVRS